MCAKPPPQRPLAADFDPTSRLFGERPAAPERRTVNSPYENTLTPATIAWLRALPSAVCPRETAVWSAQVVNRLARHWSTVPMVEAVFTEVLVQRRGGQGPVPAKVDAEMRALFAYYRTLHRPAQPENWEAKRRPPSPYDLNLNAAAAKWLEALPGSVRPVHTSRQFARIINRIARYWDVPAMTEECFDDLLVDKRRGRKGFPPEVLQELRALHAYWQSRNSRGGSSPGDMWSLVPDTDDKRRF